MEDRSRVDWGVQVGVACGGPRESSLQSSQSPEARPCLVSNTEEGALEAEGLVVRWSLRVQSACVGQDGQGCVSLDGR